MIKRMLFKATPAHKIGFASRATSMDVPSKKNAATLRAAKKRLPARRQSV